MSCKLLLNLVECIKGRSEKENCINKGRELLMRMNEVFVLKFKTVAKMQLPVLMAKHKQAFQQVSSTNYLGFCTNVFVKKNILKSKIHEKFHVRNIKGQKFQLFQPTSFTFILDQ